MAARGDVVRVELDQETTAWEGRTVSEQQESGGPATSGMRPPVVGEVVQYYQREPGGLGEPIAAVITYVYPEPWEAVREGRVDLHCFIPIGRGLLHQTRNVPYASAPADRTWTRIPAWP